MTLYSNKAAPTAHHLMRTVIYVKRLDLESKCRQYCVDWWVATGIVGVVGIDDVDSVDRLVSGALVDGVDGVVGASTPRTILVNRGPFQSQVRSYKVNRISMFAKSVQQGRGAYPCDEVASWNPNPEPLDLCFGLCILCHIRRNGSWHLKLAVHNHFKILGHDEPGNVGGIAFGSVWIQKTHQSHVISGGGLVVVCNISESENQVYVNLGIDIKSGALAVFDRFEVWEGPVQEDESSRTMP